MKSLGRLIVAIGTFAIWTATSHTANAMPQFARKFKLPCAACHDALTFPRLNDVGYKFRRAGFRMPENIGKEELTDFSMADYFSARAQADSTTDVTSQSGTMSS